MHHVGESYGLRGQQGREGQAVRRRRAERVEGCGVMPERRNHAADDEADARTLRAAFVANDDAIAVDTGDAKASVASDMPGRGARRPLNGCAVNPSQRAGLAAGALMTTAPVLAVASAAPPPLVTPRQSHERPPCARMCFGASHAKKRSAPVRRKYFAT